MGGSADELQHRGSVGSPPAGEGAPRRMLDDDDRGGVGGGAGGGASTTTTATATARSSTPRNGSPGDEQERGLSDDDRPSPASSRNDEASPSSDRPASAPASTKNKKNSDWPLRAIQEPHDNDVLFGRGGGTNHHPGNKRYRKIVEERKVDYVNSKRLDKPLVALEIIREWRAQDPPGRFLKVDEKTGLWNDVGDKKAREKTSQALREKAPQLRTKPNHPSSGDPRGSRGADFDYSDEEDETEEYNDEAEDVVKSTRFAEGTNLEQQQNNVKKAILARDHSLGREYLDEGEAVTLDGFSWQDPFQSGMSRSSSNGSSIPSNPSPEKRQPSSSQQHAPSPLPPPTAARPPPPRELSPDPTTSGSSGRFPSNVSLGPPPPPPPPGAYAHMTSEHDRHAYYASHGRYESWGSYHHPPPPPHMAGYHHPGYGPPPPPHMNSSGSWNREHSLGLNPLSHASVSQPAPYPFDSRSGSWGHPYPHPPGPYPNHHHPRAPPPPPPGQHGHPHGPRHATPPPPPTPYSPPPPIQSSSSHDSYYSPSRRPTPVAKMPASPPYTVDPAMAAAWSGQDPQELAQSWSADSGADRFEASRRNPRPAPPAAKGEAKAKANNPRRSRSPPPASARRDAAPPPAHHPSDRPDLVKRATSNQNETVETKRSLVGPSVKRAALNRDNSLASNRLKEQYVPGFRKPAAAFNAERAMTQLTENMEQSTLDATSSAEDGMGRDSPADYAVSTRGPSSRRHPPPLARNERMSTLDEIAMDLMVKPVVLSTSARSSTIDALALDLEDDPWIRPEPIQRGKTMEEVFSDLREGIPRPSSLKVNDRLTTSDLLDIVNEPLVDDDDGPMDGEVSWREGRANPPTLSREASLSGWLEGV